MKRLSEAVHVFQEACVRYDDLKEAFRDPAKAGVEFLEAREAYFACQPAYEAACQELLQFARTLHNRGRLISEYENLSTGLRMGMLRALREGGLEDLLDTRRKIRSFSELVQAWYLAKMVADVASAMRDARLRFDDQAFEEAVTQASKEDRGEAFEILIANYEDTIESFGDSDRNSWDAVRIVNDEARRNFETLSDEIIEAVAGLRASGDWEDEKHSMDLDLWRALCPYIEQHTPQPQPQAQPRWEEDPVVDVETLEGSAS
jgi:hypothetical protein